MSETKEQYKFKPEPAAIISMPAEELGKLMAETAQLRKWLFYLVERVPIDADPRLVEITSYIQPFAKRGDFKE